jgi:hypothetical protein
MTSTAELYNPTSGAFSATASMSAIRGGPAGLASPGFQSSHTATLLPNGKVLVAGGGETFLPKLATVELFDPGVGTFAATASMGTARAAHEAILLSTGTVLVLGGTNGVDGVLASAERYRPQP